MDATHKTIGPLPSVDQLIQQTRHLPIPRRLRKRLIQEQLQQWRDQQTLPAKGDISSLVEQGLCRFDQMRLRCVVNATGIVLHTNLGRAPLPLDLNSAIFQSLGYNNLELDLSTGKRGKRGLWVEKALATICQSPSSTVVNNCAAALMLILMAARRDAQSEVILSRGELVQIGGGFRIPEILESAGIRLREVGTTNHTTLEDYRRAIGDHTVMILKVHQSNFAMTGFVASPPLKALADLAREHDCPLVFDLGSGALVDTKEHFDIDREITPAEAIHQGVDLVCFSGDKLMGGPQAGIIAGNTTHINHLKQHPMFRALRIDKVTLGVLEQVAEHHLVSQDDRSTLKRRRFLPMEGSASQWKSWRHAPNVSWSPSEVTLMGSNRWTCPEVWEVAPCPPRPCHPLAWASPLPINRQIASLTFFGISPHPSLGTCHKKPFI